MPLETVNTTYAGVNMVIATKNPIPYDHYLSHQEARGNFSGIEVHFVKDGKLIPARNPLKVIWDYLEATQDLAAFRFKEAMRCRPVNNPAMARVCNIRTIVYENYLALSK